MSPRSLSLPSLVLLALVASGCAGAQHRTEPREPAEPAEPMEPAEPAPAEAEVTLSTGLRRNLADLLYEMRADWHAYRGEEVDVGDFRATYAPPDATGRIWMDLGTGIYSYSAAWTFVADPDGAQARLDELVTELDGFVARGEYGLTGGAREADSVSYVGTVEGRGPFRVEVRMEPVADDVVGVWMTIEGLPPRR